MLLKTVHGLRTILAAAFFCGLTLLMTRPLLFRVDSAIIGWVGDNFYFLWLVGWFQHALIDLHTSPLHVPWLNYPAGWQLAYDEITSAMVLLALPASFFAGPTFGYNFALLLTFLLSGLGVYWWVRKLTGCTAAGIIAGTIFAFVPYRMSHLLGHLNLIGTQWFPFYFMSLHGLLARPSRSWWHSGMAALFLGLIGMTSQYYLYMTLLLSLVYVALFLLLFDRRLLLRWDRFWRRFVVCGLLTAPLLFLAVWPYFQLAGQGDLTQHSFEAARIWSASLTDFLLPSTQHFLWGTWVEEAFNRSLWVESNLYIGAVTLVLTAIAAVSASHAMQRRKLIWLWVLVAFVAFILALGTDLHWLGEPVIVDVPAWLQQYHPYPRTFIPLPGYFLFKFLPYYAQMRGWMRYGIFVSLFASLLAGFGAAWVLQKVQKPLRTLMAIGLVLLIVIDFFPASHLLSTVAGRPVDHWLAEQAGAGAVVEFPLTQTAKPEAVYYASVYNKPFLGGSHGAFYPPQFQRIQPVLSQFPTPECVPLLRQLGVRWLIVHASDYPNFAQVDSTIQALGLRFRVAFGQQFIYELQ
jgi:hypothetical protein